MSVSVKLELDMRYQKKDSTYPLKLLIVINRKPIRVPLGYAIEAKDWNESKQTVRTSCKRLQNITRLNAQLTSKKANALTLLTTLEDQGKLQRTNKAEIKSLLLGKTNIETDLIQFFNIRIAEMTVTGNIGNARVYRNVRNSIKGFLDQKDIPLSQVSYEWLKNYETWFLGKGNRLNGLSINLRTLRALLNQGIKRNLLDEKFYPFKHYSIKKEATRKRAIAESDIEKIKEYKPTTLRQTWAKDYFLMSYYTMGASFIDLAFLKVADWKDDRIRYTRKKGGKLYNIKVTPPLRSLFEKYSKGKGSDDFILNAIRAYFGDTVPPVSVMLCHFPSSI